MKINEIEPILLTVDLPPEHPLRWSSGQASSVHCALVRIHTNTGITGLGECYGGGFTATRATGELFRMFSPLLEGKNPCDVATCFEWMYRSGLYWGRSGLVVAAISAIENALWDIAGKASEKPVHELLGGICHQRLPVYASGGLEMPLDELKEEMRSHLRSGFRAVKMRIGGDLEHDRERVATCREVLGPDVKLMVDAVMGHHPKSWTSSEAIQRAKSLEPYDLYWFEEPCFAADYEGYARVRQKTCIPISGGESSAMRYEFKHFFEHASLDIAQPDASHAGGILECLKIAAMADAYGVKVAPHAWGSSVVVAANLAWAFAAPNTIMAEYPTWHYPITDELWLEKPLVKDGWIHAPSMPGLGVHLPIELEEKYAFRPEVAGLNLRCEEKVGV